jgi:hypothetical protein
MKIIHWVDEDNKFLRVQEQILAKRRMLLIQQTKINEVSKTNHYLEDVKKDYERYEKVILQQKNEQIQALNMLSKYVDDLTKSGVLSKHNMDDAINERVRIQREIESIKNNVDRIIENVSDMAENM